MRSALRWFQIICMAVVCAMMGGCSSPAISPPPPPAAGRSPMSTSLVNPPVLAGKFALNEQFPTVQSLLDNLREEAIGPMQQQELTNGEFEPDDNRQWARVRFKGSATQRWDLGIQFVRDPDTSSNVARAWIRTASLNDVAPSDADVRQIAARLKTALEEAFPPHSASATSQPAAGVPRRAAKRPAKAQARKKARPKPG